MVNRFLKLALIFVFVAFLGVLTSGQTHADILDGYCAQPARLTAGGTGRVTNVPNLPNRVRDVPSFSGRVLVFIPAGESFHVVSGPVCQSGTWWWQVAYQGVVGWTGEGNGYGTYWLEPVQNPVVCALPNRLSVNGYGQVTPGLPNVMRTGPGTQATGSTSRVIGEIPAGGVFRVLSGPQCGSDSRWWWLVDYNGAVGWTAEGEGSSTYWTTPWASSTVCPGFMLSRLVVGRYGRVTPVPPLPNRVRIDASYGSAVLGQIPPGGVFSVLSGPRCSGNTAWWQVQYGSLVGWTAEGSGATYWLEPW